MHSSVFVQNAESLMSVLTYSLMSANIKHTKQPGTLTTESRHGRNADPAKSA